MKIAKRIIAGPVDDLKKVIPSEYETITYENSESERQKLIEGLVEKRRKVIKNREKRKKDRREHIFDIGDFIKNVWGQDQTNVDFYEVVAVKPKSIDIRKVKSKVVKEGDTTEYVVPIEGNYTDNQMTKRVQSKNTVKMDYGVGIKWDGNPVGQTVGGGH